MTTQILLPFKIITSCSTTGSQCSLNIQLELIPVKEQIHPLEDLKLRLNFHSSYNNSNLSVTTGDFDFNNKTKTAVWSINKLDRDANATLKGNLTCESSEPVVLSFSCRIDKYTVTGGSVSKVSISKNPRNFNIYKGGKNTTYIRNLEMII
jgi:hypothetical protein